MAHVNSRLTRGDRHPDDRLVASHAGCVESPSASGWLEPVAAGWGSRWAYWHLPVNLAGYNDCAHPIWNAVLFFPLVVMGTAFSFAWLTRRTGSVWPAAIAHGANNCISVGFLLEPQGWGWDTVTAVAAAAMVGGLFAYLSARRSKADVVAQPSLENAPRLDAQRDVIASS